MSSRINELQTSISEGVVSAGIRRRYWRVLVQQACAIEPEPSDALEFAGVS